MATLINRGIYKLDWPTKTVSLRTQGRLQETAQVQGVFYWKSRQALTLITSPEHHPLFLSAHLGSVLSASSTYSKKEVGDGWLWQDE